MAYFFVILKEREIKHQKAQNKIVASDDIQTHTFRVLDHMLYH